MYLYLSNCNIPHSNLWLNQIENLNNQTKNGLQGNLTIAEYNHLSSCCQYLLNEMSTKDIYNLCLLNFQMPALNYSEPKVKLCLPILQNLTLFEICYKHYCSQWFKNFTSIYQQKFQNNHDITLQKRKEKYSELSDRLSVNDMNDSIEKYKGLLCQINSTWAFRLINSKYYPYFGQNLGLVNNTKAIVVLQAKVRNLLIILYI